MPKLTKDTPVTVVMALSKDTKGTHVYAEPNVPGKFFPVVYIQKSQVEEPAPLEIEVTIRVKTPAK